MASLPLWAVYTVGVGSPLATAAIALYAQIVSRSSIKALEDQSRREEVLRCLRWAAELAVSDDLRKARLGIEELEALRAYKLLSKAEEGFVDAACRAAIEEVRQAIKRAPEAQIIATTDLSAVGEVLVESEEESTQEEGGHDA